MTKYGSIPQQDSRDETSPSPPQQSRRCQLGQIALVSAALCVVVVWMIGSTTTRASVPLLGDSPKPQAHFYKQITDHYTHEHKNNVYPKHYQQRYYQKLDHWKGPGHPIFVVLGGEDALDDLIYYNIHELLPKRFGGAAFGLEHRFYGQSLPVGPLHLPDEYWSNNALKDLLSPAQAVWDIVHFVQHQREKLGCSKHRGKHYCPVVIVGGSYPGYLAFLSRYHFPHVIDVGYAGSAPLLLYHHSVDPLEYYRKVTQVADQAVPGCADAIKTTLLSIQAQSTQWTIPEMAQQLGLCPDTIPSYITTTALLLQEVNMIVAVRFADFNMFYYPPGPDTGLATQCRRFVSSRNNAIDETHAAVATLREFLDETSNNPHADTDGCFDLQFEVPPGHHGRITASDWSGVEGGPAGLSWDFASCVLATPVGLGDSMFLEQHWSIQWLQEYCYDRFDYTPSYEKYIRDEFRFDEFFTSPNTTRLLLTNGLNDGWSVASVLQAPNEHVKVLNFPHGAHHSDLTVVGPGPWDTSDVAAGVTEIGDVLEEWIHESKEKE